MQYLNVEALKKDLKKANRTFLYNTEEEQDEDLQMVFIFFVGKNEQGKEVVCNTCISTLIFEYIVALMNKSEEVFLYTHPEAKGEDMDNLPEKLEKEFDELIDEMHASNEIKVQEELTVEFISEEMDMVEMHLNVEALTEEAILKFVQTYQQGKFEVDKSLYSFDLREDG